MSKLRIFIIILIATFFALLIQVIFGNFISARLSTLPYLRNWDLFNPRAPIVVTNRETVRVSDSSDAVETTNAVKNKLATVIYYDGTGTNTHVVVSGGAVNWTSDGYFVSTTTAMAVPNKTYAIVLNNGDIFPIKNAYFDTASKLVILETDARGLATIEPVDSKELRPGEKILMVLNSIGVNKTTFLESYVNKFASDLTGLGLNSDEVGRTVAVQTVGALTPGHVAINLSGRLAGIWDGSRVISTDAIRVFANDFFKNNKQVIRPSYGFTYRELSTTEARAVQLVAGAQVIGITPLGVASTAKIQVGDVITAVNGVKVSDDDLLESSLATLVPGETATLTIFRNGQTLTAMIVPKILE